MPSFFCMPIGCNRQIESFDRRQANLTEVPHEIARYRGLDELILATNSIGALPSSVFKLYKLRFLDISDNKITILPPEVQNLQNLVFLNISRNEISDLPQELRHCKLLVDLDVSTNPITRLPDSIVQCTSLQRLAINDSSITQLPQEIGNLVNLRVLECRENLIRALPPSISKLRKLEVLDIGQNEMESLPEDIGFLESLREFYADSNNDLESLPQGITNCRKLEQIDFAQNKITSLPEDIGNLTELTDVVLSENQIRRLPNSIGRLRKLTIMKVDDNELDELTEQIGNCESLSELLLTKNNIQAIPASIGNLKNLTNFNMGENFLATIPTAIDGCKSLSILSLRGNQISELPMEIGRCEKLTVLDLANNKLNHLPFTINVLFKLQALWLSENQSQAMLRLQEGRDPRNNMKVLTCYLLPQKNSTGDGTAFEDRRSNFLGGPKVHFGDQEATVDEEALPVGEFERHDTPKPKSHKDKLKKNSIDGHVIHHDAAHNSNSTTLSLTRKTSETTSPQPPMAVPRSALKHQSIPPTNYEPENSEQPSSSSAFREERNTPSKSTVSSDDQLLRRIQIQRTPEGYGLSIAGGLESTPYKDNDNGIFVSKVNPRSAADVAGLRTGDKLIRVNGVDVTNVTHDIAVNAMKLGPSVVEVLIQRSPSAPVNVTRQTPEHSMDVSFMSDTTEVMSLTRETISATIKRDQTGSPGFSILGGAGSGRDHHYISAITPGGPADQYGKLMLGDILVSLNGIKMKGVLHDQAVAMLIGHAYEDLFLVVQRERQTTSSFGSPFANSTLMSANTTVTSPAPPTSSSTSNLVRSPSISVPIHCLGDTSNWDGKEEEIELEKDGKSLGLSVVGGSDHSCHPYGIGNPGVFISKIAVNSPAARSGRLRLGDRILRVNNTDVRTAEHRVAVEALKNSGAVVKLRVHHEPQPQGLKEVVLRREHGRSLGMNIHGGVGKAVKHSALEPSDEGIFIDKVDSGSVSEKAGLVPGLRLVEVNGESLLGCDQHEAAQLLTASNDLRVLVCDGYNSPAKKAVSANSVYSSGVDENVGGPSLPASPDLPVSPSAVNGSHSSSIATSPVPPPTAPKPTKIPPPVAPKPTLRTSQTTNVPSADNPEKLTFASKLKKFEQIESRQTSASSLPPPEKRSLLTVEDIKRLKEEEQHKVFPSMPLSPERDDDPLLNSLRDNGLMQSRPPSSIKSLKAEISTSIDNDSLSESEKRELEVKQRREWREARLKSIDQERTQCDAMFERIRNDPLLASISENVNGDTGISEEGFKRPMPASAEISFADE